MFCSSQWRRISPNPSRHVSESASVRVERWTGRTTSTRITNSRPGTDFGPEPQNFYRTRNANHSGENWKRYNPIKLFLWFCDAKQTSLWYVKICFFCKNELAFWPKYWFIIQDEASDDESKKEEIFSTSHGETESES